MRMILFYLPLIILVVGFLFGQIRVGRVAIFFVCWVAISILLTFYGFDPFEPAKFVWTLIGIGLALVAIPAAVLFGLATSKPVSPAPVVIAAETVIETAGKARTAYDGLSPENQRRLKQAGRLGVKFGLGAFADFLSRKGHESAAKAARAGVKLV